MISFIFIKASNLVLVSNRITQYLDNQYKSQFLLLNIQKDGKYCYVFDTDMHTYISTGRNNLSKIEKNAMNDFSKLFANIERPLKIHITYFQNKNDYADENFTFKGNKISSENKTYDLLLSEKLDSIKELYFNHENFTFYYVNNNGCIEYIDCIPLLNKYSDFFEPIKIIKNTFFLNFFIIFKNFITFLKIYFFVAYDNQRLKQSLQRVLLTNVAYKLFFHLGYLYALLLFFTWKQNISCENIFLGQACIGGLGYIFSNQISFLINKIVSKCMEMPSINYS